MAKKTDDTAGTDVTTYDDKVSELYAQTKTEQSPLFSDDILSEIDTPEQLAEFLASQGVVSESIESYGTGFRVVRDKRQLIDVPLALIQWRFNIGDKGAMVIVHAMTQDKRKVIFVDGGTGIRDQLERVTVERRKRAHKHPQAALSIPGGLRVSDYTFEDPKTGEERDASTFYLAE